MRHALILLSVAAISVAANAAGTDQRPEGPAFKVFQFPHDAIPRIDGSFEDWDMVPSCYAVGMDMMWDDSGKYEGTAVETMDLTVKVGWVEGLNRLYFYYEAYDDFWDFKRHSLKNDTFEVVVDGDLSGGTHIAKGDGFFSFQNRHAQNYHIMTPAEDWKSWAMVWGPQDWLKDFPYANHAYSYDFSDGSPGILKMEFYITVYDDASPDGPLYSKESPLYEGKEIGLCWAVIDYDGGESKDAFWNLSKYHTMYGNASHERLFILQGPEKAEDKKIESIWDYSVEKGSRTANFTDHSRGRIDSWFWEFGDGTTSTERNPVHTYDGNRNQYTATLTVSGPDGQDICCKVRQVHVW